MPEAYQRGGPPRASGSGSGRGSCGTRRRCSCPGAATALEARRLLHVRRPACGSCPLAAATGVPPAAPAAGAAREAERLGLGPRYAVYAGRYDARQDLPTLLEALARLAREPAPDGIPRLDGATTGAARVARVAAPRSASWGRRPTTAPPCRARRPRGRRGRDGLCPAAATRAARGARGRGAVPRPAGHSEATGLVGARGDRGGRAGRGQRRRRAARGRRARPGSSWSPATPPGSRRRSAPPGRTTTSTRSSSRRRWSARRDDAHLGRRGVGDAGGLGGRRPAGAVPLGAARRARPRRVACISDQRTPRLPWPPAVAASGHLALLDRRPEALGDHLDERLARGERDLLAVACRRSGSGAVIVFLRHSPLIVLPLVAIQADALALELRLEAVLRASRR